MSLATLEKELLFTHNLSPLEEEVSGLGFKTDIAILTILDTATLNKSLEVVQIV